MNNKFVISQTYGGPMYLQIMEQIKMRIAVGDWKPGQKIPSIRELAVAIRVSMITVKRAYLELEREGVIVTQQGKGSFIASDIELGEKLHQQELEKLLKEAARLAILLGLSPEELQTRLRETQDMIKKEQT